MVGWLVTVKSGEIVMTTGPTAQSEWLKNRSKCQMSDEHIKSWDFKTLKNLLKCLYTEKKSERSLLDAQKY